MELNRQQIIKALECCTDKKYHCEDCPYFYKSEGIKSSMEILMTDALSLIKELTEENERLKSVEFTCGFVKPHKVLECPIFDEIERTKADTAREIIDDLESRILPSGEGLYSFPVVTHEFIAELKKKYTEDEK